MSVGPISIDLTGRTGKTTVLYQRENELPSEITLDRSQRASAAAQMQGSPIRGWILESLDGDLLDESSWRENDMVRARPAHAEVVDVSLDGTVDAEMVRRCMPNAAPV